MSSRVSPFISKFQNASGGYCFELEERARQIKPIAPPPTGPYFFYGTLMDPSLLSEILELPTKPTLRPAKLAGYSLKLWGQYPALLGGFTGNIIQGMVYNVETEAIGGRLAEYETKAYRAAPCMIQFTDAQEPPEVDGWTFEYAGNPMDISDGEFDLDVWLQRMGRVRSVLR